jgi:predicted PolB exonuclease-like 3'-5' exonuclease
MQDKTVLIFDIETIPDTEPVRNLLKLNKEEQFSEIELRKKLSDYHFEITDGKNDFSRQLFHKVVCISYVEANLQIIDNKNISLTINKLQSNAITDYEGGEEALIRGFWSNFEKKKPILVTFNGRTFDIPALRYRALKYDIQCEWFFKAGTKWDNNYKSKYCQDVNLDLLDSFSDFGGSARIKMEEVCSLLNIPCKLDAKGDGVSKMFDEGKIQEIKDYCETDVLATYLLYIKYLYHIGNMDLKSLKKHESDLESYLANNPSTKIQEFLSLWQKKSS